MFLAEERRWSAGEMDFGLRSKVGFRCPKASSCLDDTAELMTLTDPYGGPKKTSFTQRRKMPWKRQD